MLTEMMNFHIYTNEERGTVPGYRVQLISSGNRTEVLRVKLDLHKKMPDLETHLIYHKPYFKLRAGDYLTKLAAYKMLLDLRELYPDVFIVTDEISVAEL
jgi:hypothetical protein